jgi:osmotically-inducible protein OsmY
MTNRYDFDDDFDRNVMDRNIVSRRYRGNATDRDINDYSQRNVTGRSDLSNSRYGYGGQSRNFNDEPMSGYYDDYGRDTDSGRSNRINQSSNTGFNQGINRDRDYGRYNPGINRELDAARYNQNYGYNQNYEQNYGQSYSQNYGQDLRDVGNVNRGYSNRDFDNRVVEQDYSREYQNFGGRDLNRDYNARSSNVGRNVGPHIGRGPRGYQRSDERIREEICELLWRHDMIDASDIDVVVINGEVTLTGLVDSRLTKRLAEDVLEDVNGVRDIHNQLKVKQDQRFEQQLNTQSNLQTNTTTSTPVTNTQTRATTGSK